MASRPSAAASQHQHTSSQSSTRSAKAGKPAQITVPSYASFQPDTRSSHRKSPPVRRKPLPTPTTSSPPLPRLSSGGTVIASFDATNPEENLPPTFSPPAQIHAVQKDNSPQIFPRDLDQYPRGLSPNIPQSPGHTSFADLPADQARQLLQNLEDPIYPPLHEHHAKRSSASPQNSPLRHVSKPSNEMKRSMTMPHRIGSSTTVQTTNDPRPLTSNGPSKSGKTSNKITSFFGWKGTPTSPIAESSPTTISDRSTPVHSPMESSNTSFPSSVSQKSVPNYIDVSKANAPATAQYQNGAYPQPPLTPAMSIKIEEMEEELREITTELASSIRREMELEDQVERLQLEGPNALDGNKRTSDYFSDSATSSVTGGGSKAHEVEKLKRRSEQERAQMKLDVSQKLQEERSKRKAMEAHIRQLEEQLEIAERNQGGGQNRDLESALEEHKRKLQEERQVKQSYEDLLQALKGDLEHTMNERDNLRDEVVPQLRARVEGLETAASEHQKLTYEHAHMQQELHALKTRSIDSIAEEGFPLTPMTPSAGLMRSASSAKPMSSGRTRGNSLSRSNSTSKERESRESLADRVKEVVLQRDALHKALKSLLDRQRFQIREHEKRVKALEIERDRALGSRSPRSRGYEAEVKDLRFEINELRKRADDALEQKWQCEKGLGGLKKDLDRAEQETSSLRELLRKNDILVPELSSPVPKGSRKELPATSASLERAYKELRDAHSQSITRLKEIKGIPTGADDKATDEHLAMLLRTMSEAEAERDYAQRQADAYRAQADSLHDVSVFHETEKENLATQLRATSQRVEALASQVRTQLESNSGLRTRLAEAVGKGEREQRASAERINSMQQKLKSLEERLMAAQMHSEDAVLEHEEQVKSIRGSTNLNLTRLGRSHSAAGGRSPTLSVGPRSPLYGAKSPRLGSTSSGVGRGMTEVMKTEALEKRVRELEKALAEAEAEMGEVVQRMNAAQIEAMELQSARDEAARQTRNLQNQIVAENEKVGQMLSSMPPSH